MLSQTQFSTNLQMKEEEEEEEEKLIPQVKRSREGEDYDVNPPKKSRSRPKTCSWNVTPQHEMLRISRKGISLSPLTPIRASTVDTQKTIKSIQIGAVKSQGVSAKNVPSDVEFIGQTLMTDSSHPSNATTTNTGATSNTGVTSIDSYMPNMNEALIATSDHAATTKHSSASTTLTNGKISDGLGASSNRTTESGHSNAPIVDTRKMRVGSIARRVDRFHRYSQPCAARNSLPDPSIVSRSDHLPNTCAQRIIPTTASVQSALAWWNHTPFTLVDVGNVMCPRLYVTPRHGLYHILGSGYHQLGPAIAKIHNFAKQAPSVPPEVAQVLVHFQRIHDNFYDNPQVTLLDPTLYSSPTHSQAQLESYRRKEWGWLLRIGRSYEISPMLLGKWDLNSIHVDYKELKIALTLSRDTHRMIYFPPSQSDDPSRIPYILQVRSDLYIYREISDLFRYTRKPGCGALFLRH